MANNEMTYISRRVIILLNLLRISIRHSIVDAILLWLGGSVRHEDDLIAKTFAVPSQDVKRRETAERSVQERRNKRMR